MKFASTRDIRNNPSEFREAVERDDIVLTVNGKPFAVAMGIDEGEFEETLDLLSQLRALRAMARLQKTAAERGLSGMTIAEIDEEIREARAGRQSEF
ncbi:MAG: type II toxin-antitoxin system prevent-host-death family antitoxin [Longimicrobiaceae bacterium]